MTSKPAADLSLASQTAWPGLVADLTVIAEGAGVAEADFDELADMLRIRDRLAAIAVKLGEDGLVVTGSTGQPVAHPLIAVEADLRAAL